MSLQTTETRQLDKSDTTAPTRVLTPRADVLESPDSFTIVAELPGVDEASLDVELEKNVLSIHGKSAVDVPEGATRVFGEYVGSDFSRKFALSNRIDTDGISATIESGLLTVVLPKTKEAVGKRIEVKAN